MLALPRLLHQPGQHKGAMKRSLCTIEWLLSLGEVLKNPMRGANLVNKTGVNASHKVMYDWQNIGLGSRAFKSLYAV